MTDLRRKVRQAIYALEDRLRSTPRPLSHRRSAFIGTLTGQALCDAANRALAVRGRDAPRFAWAADRGLYECHDAGRCQVFAHAPRVIYYLGGLDARVAKLWGEYHLDRVPFANGDRVVDVGANTGDLSLGLAALDRGIHITAFEPSPPEFAALERNLAARAPGATGVAHRLALWHSAADALTFYVKSASADSSLIEIEDPEEIVSVPTARLDAILPAGRFRLLKLEAEGAEPEILQGAEGVIDRFDFISADVGFERGLRRDSTEPEVTAFLATHGFAPVVRGAKRLVVLFRNLATTEAPA